MLHFLPPSIRGVLATLLFFCYTVFWCVILYGLALVRLVLRRGWKERCSQAMVWVAEAWIAGNSFEMRLFHQMKWNIHLPADLRMDVSYLVISNHQSWVDIVVIQHVLNRKIPFLRFFLKSDLRFVPFLGAAWKALDFPFMKRYSRDFLMKHPEKRGEDLKETKRACDRLVGKPISILNFLEGTRFSAAKRAQTGSSFQNLLNPKAGGIAFVMEAMGEQFESILDITLHYAGGAGSIWDLFSGQIGEVTVWVERIPIPREFLNGNYLDDGLFRAQIQEWIQQIWRAKDERLAKLA